MVRSLGAGPGGWGAVTNLPHAIYVTTTDEMRARQVLDLSPAEIEERDGQQSYSRFHPSTMIIALLIIAMAALLFGTVELVINRMFR